MASVVMRTFDPLRRRAMGTRWRSVEGTAVLPWIGWGEPRPHGRQGWTSLFGDPSRWWRPAETKEARSSLL